MKKRRRTHRRDPVIATGVMLIGSQVRNCLRNVEGLGARGVPPGVQTEGEAIEPLVAHGVNIRLDRFRVVAARPARVVGLLHLERRAGLVVHVGHFCNGTLILVIEGIPAS